MKNLVILHARRCYFDLCAEWKSNPSHGNQRGVCCQQLSKRHFLNIQNECLSQQNLQIFVIQVMPISMCKRKKEARGYVLLLIFSLICRSCFNVQHVTRNDNVTFLNASATTNDRKLICDLKDWECKRKSNANYPDVPLFKM